jgi:hypothetical protein
VCVVSFAILAYQSTVKPESTACHDGMNRDDLPFTSNPQKLEHDVKLKHYLPLGNFTSAT